MASKVCGCNALTVPHVHDANGIRAASEMEKKLDAAPAGAAARFSTPVQRG